MNPKNIWHDPVVAEIHAVRERLAKEYQNDLTAYSKAATKRCKDLGLIAAEPKRTNRRAAAV